MQFIVRITLTALLLGISPASAQVQGADPEFTKHVLDALQAQRNRAMDEAASAEAQLAKAQAQNIQLRARVKELENKYEPKEQQK